ncbi:hypothetical protein SAMN05216316_0210 [Nitrosovibrio sp. Nv6]|nr:hypothetical protein SAMN05216316_0210 [Nitrosovibrio sp. Nv6]
MIIAFANDDMLDVYLLREFSETWSEFERTRVAHWPRLGREARILLAKLSFLLQDIEKETMK